MLKKEVIWREILFQKRQNNIVKFTQKELSQKFGFSISTIFNALRSPRQANIVRVTGRYFVLEDYKKLLYLWASSRNKQKDIYQKFFIDKETAKIESVVPPEAVFGLYSGFKVLYNYFPAEYDHVYIYLKRVNLPELEKRMTDSPKNRRDSTCNLFVMEPDPWLEKYPQPLPEQLFVDIWNAPEWYAKDFLKSLEEKIINL